MVLLIGVGWEGLIVEGVVELYGRCLGRSGWMS